MAIKINFDLAGNPEIPTFVLAHKNGNKIGMLEANKPVLRDCLNAASEVTFSVYKTLDGKDCPIWDDIVDFKLLWCKEWNTWFEITVEMNVDDEDNLYKNIIATSLCETELSQINLNNIEINTEDDIARDDYTDPTVFYNPDDAKCSLLNRISEKMPHYKWGHIDDHLKNIQRTFSFDGISIYDALQEIAEEIGCIFIFDNSSDANGKPSRTITVYDLMTYCKECKYRGEFTTKCPSCGSEDKSDFIMPYGTDTTIYLSNENYAEEITYSINTDKVKNCFKLEAGDDLMTAMIRSCNPNGSDYIWHISDSMKTDMSQELRDKLSDYDERYASFQEGGDFHAQSSNSNADYYISPSLISAYNSYYNEYKDLNEDLESIGKASDIKSYSDLMNAYYNIIDMQLFLESGLMPLGVRSENADEVVSSLRDNLIEPVGVIGLSSNTNNATIENAVKYMIEAVIEPYYSVTVNTSSISSNKTQWRGTVTVTSINNSEDSCTSSSLTITLSDYKNCTASYIQAKLQAALKSSKISDYGITQLFAYNTDSNGGTVSDFKMSLDTFKEKLDLYCLNSLVSFRDACQTVLDILMEQGMADTSSSYYESLYSEYYERLQAIEDKIGVRESQIENVQELENYIIDIRDSIQSSLDFEVFLGSTLWKEFAAYRREDTYLNSNYISDGLSNSELIANAKEFIEEATKDLYKSGELQHTISSSLKNLLLMDEFKPLLNYFEVGNYLRVEIDNKIYRLRLIEYKIDFDNLDSLYVEFSDATRVINGVSDLESLLNQSQSMATSYDNIAHQAKKGNEGYGRLTDWVEKGLDVTNTNIVNTADNNVMTYDEHGILMREYDPVTETYSNKQVKITNKGLYMTDNSWKSAKVGVGNFIYYHPKDEKYYESFGVIADTLVGDLILGEEVGIYTQKNDITINDLGLYISNKPYADVTTNETTEIIMNPSADSPFEITYGDNSVIRVSNDGILYIDKKLDINDGNFVVHDDGSIDMAGSIDMDGDIVMQGNITLGGNINWGSSLIVTLYRRNIEHPDEPSKDVPVGSYNAYPNTSETNWHRSFDSANDKWLSRSFDGGATWEKPERITYLTYIDAGGIYTGTLKADQIQGRHISTKTFDNADENNDYGYMDLYKQMIFFNENDVGAKKGDTKMAIGFLKGTQFNEPIIVMGAGDNNGSNVGYINKGDNHFSMYYKVDDKKLNYIKMYNDEGVASIRINGVDFPQQAGDKSVMDFMQKADYWNNKLEVIKEGINKTNTIGIPDGGLGSTISIDPANLGAMFTVDEETSTIYLRPDVVLSWNAVYALYARTNLSKPTKAYSEYSDSSSSNWHKVLNSSYDYYASYSYDGGKTWSNAVQIKGINGMNGEDGKDGSDANVPDYIQSTYIDFEQVASPQIKGNFVLGGKIMGGSFSDKNEIGRLELSNRTNQYADLIFYRENNNQELFRIYDNLDTASIYLYGHSIGFGSETSFYPYGSWNFVNATIQNLKVTFG